MNEFSIHTKTYCCVTLYKNSIYSLSSNHQPPKIFSLVSSAYLVGFGKASMLCGYPAVVAYTNIVAALTLAYHPLLSCMYRTTTTFACGSVHTHTHSNGSKHSSKHTTHTQAHTPIQIEQTSTTPISIFNISKRRAEINCTI